MHNKDVIFDIGRNRIGLVKARCDAFHSHSPKVINSVKEDSVKTVQLENTSIINTNASGNMNKSEDFDNVSTLETVHDEGIY